MAVKLPGLHIPPTANPDVQTFCKQVEASLNMLNNQPAQVIQRQASVTAVPSNTGDIAALTALVGPSRYARVFLLMGA